MTSNYSSYRAGTDEQSTHYGDTSQYTGGIDGSTMYGGGQTTEYTPHTPAASSFANFSMIDDEDEDEDMMDQESSMKDNKKEKMSKLTIPDIG